MKALLKIRPWHKVAFAVFGLLIMSIVRWDDLSMENDASSWAEISGWILLIIGFWFAGDFEARFRSLFERLFRRDLINDLQETSESTLLRMEVFAKRMALTGSLAFCVVLLVAYWIVKKGEMNEDCFFVGKLLLETIAAFLVGGHAGRIVAYGFLGMVLKRGGAHVSVKLGHPDRAGGLKIVGDFYLFQAALVMIPLIFFAFWWAVSPAWEGKTTGDSEKTVVSEVVDDRGGSSEKDDDEKKSGSDEEGFLRWREYLATFFFVMLLIEVLAFVLPMNYFHQEMVRSASAFACEADAVGREILCLDERINEMSFLPEREEMEGKRKQLVARFQLLESAPTWPVDSSVRRRFSIGNATIVVLPLLSKIPIVETAIDNLIGN